MSDMKSLLLLFGKDLDAGKKQRPKKRLSVAEKYNYSTVEFDAKGVFTKYDIDDSGTIDEDELEDMLYDLGVTLSEENINEAKEKLGMMAEGSSCDFGTFEAWWNGSHGAKKEHRNALLAGLAKELQEQMIPDIKAMFAEADKDKSGALDRPEFENFYPELREYLGYEIPPFVQCLNEMDTGSFSNGQIEYEEFESWFLEMETKRARNGGTM